MHACGRRHRLELSAVLQRGWMVSLIICCVLWLAGCAQPAPRAYQEEDSWRGRIALQVDGQAAQSFSSTFELQGNPESGSLVLLSPFGNRIAQLEWKDGQASLQSGQETRTSDSLETLLLDVTGTRIPIAALFSWLNGTQATAPGWQADLSGMPDGRLTARREHPTPQAILRIVLTR